MNNEEKNKIKNKIKQLFQNPLNKNKSIGIYELSRKFEIDKFYLIPIIIELKNEKVIDMITETFYYDNDYDVTVSVRYKSTEY